MCDCLVLCSAFAGGGRQVASSLPYLGVPRLVPSLASCLVLSWSYLLVRVRVRLRLRLRVLVRVKVTVEAIFFCTHIVVSLSRNVASVL